jgi:hypothetical protein
MRRETSVPKRRVSRIAHGVAMTNPIAFRQTAPANRTTSHKVTNQVISTLTAGNFLQQIPLQTSMREFLFEMRKDGGIYWVGVAVPDGVSDFTKVHVFFHPTVVNGGQVHAADGDYQTFTGGWSRSLQRYVAMQGGQLAGARLMPLIVPFMTMAATTGKGPSYMFATRPVETLNAIMSAVSQAATGKPDPVATAAVAVSSFSSGIGAMELFISAFGASGLIVETTDFDGPFIKTRKQAVTAAPGANGRVFTQRGLPGGKPTPGWFSFPAWQFKKVSQFRDKGVHAQIGWMMFFLAAMSSTMK